MDRRKLPFRGLLFGMCFFLLAGCGSDDTKGKVEQESNSVVPEQVKHVIPESWKSLVSISSIDTNIVIDLRYATDNNFTKSVLYDTMRNAYLQEVVAQRLSDVQSFLSSIKPGYRLVVYDAMRPRSVQQRMWDLLDSIPFGERVKFVSNPKSGSVHNYGAAVDVSILNEKGETLDMGAGYDDMRHIAYPMYEDSFKLLGLLTQQQIENRVLLRKVMRRKGFINIPTEWWHFNAFPRAIAKRKFDIIE